MHHQRLDGSVVAFVPTSERDRLLLAFAELIYEHGYDTVELSDLARVCDLELDAVHRYWRTKDACAIDAIDTGAERAFAAVARTFMQAGGDGPLAAHQSLQMLLTVLAANPALASLAIAAPSGLDHRGAAHRTGLQDVFANFLGPGLATLGTPPPQSEITASVLAGGVYELLREYVSTRRIDELPDALPALSYLVISAFFGRDEAERIRRAHGA